MSAAAGLSDGHPLGRGAERPRHDHEEGHRDDHLEHERLALVRGSDDGVDVVERTRAASNPTAATGRPDRQLAGPARARVRRASGRGRRRAGSGPSQTADSRCRWPMAGFISAGCAMIASPNPRQATIAAVGRRDLGVGCPLPIAPGVARPTAATAAEQQRRDRQLDVDASGEVLDEDFRPTATRRAGSSRRSHGGGPAKGCETTRITA